MVKSYGIPYQGSKNKIAEYIVYCVLAPAAVGKKGVRLIDAFGGGGAITACAALSGFFDEIVYNDLNSELCNFVKETFKGENTEKLKNIGFVLRDVFKNPGTEFYKKLLFSFGENMIDYAFSPDNEIKALNEFKENGKINFGSISGRIERCQRQSILKKYNIKFISKEYQEIDYKENDIIYFDPPYKDTCGYGEKISTFDTEAFLNFASNLKSKNVFISEYNIENKKFKEIASIKRNSTFSASNNNLIKKEKIYKKI